MLAQVVTELRAVQAILIQVNSKKGASKPKIEPVLTPLTALTRLASKVRWDRRLRRHDELVRKLLPKHAEGDE